GVQEHVFKYAQTWFERDGQKVPYTIDDLKTNRPNDWQKCVQQAEYIRGEYEKLRDRANEVRRLYGREEIPYIEDYMT
ncbi:hypothetical protein ABTN50_20610, partial [Acinetobacter baumannii]